MYEFYDDEHGDMFDSISPNVSLSATIKGEMTPCIYQRGKQSEQYLEMKDYKLRLEGILHILMYCFPDRRCALSALM